MNCPACKMETPEELGYCDFCKEPFRRKPAPAEQRPKEEVAVPPQVMAKLLAAKRTAEAAPAGPVGTIPPEFAALDDGGRIPEVPASARKLAWIFLASVLLLGAVALTYMAARSPRRLPLPMPPPLPPGAVAPERPPVMPQMPSPPSPF